jgi:CheY-like chemotaxis protein
MLMTIGAETPARLLIAEDDQLLSATLAEFLREEGHEVTMAQDGAAALEAAIGLDFDILLTDLRMPVMDGMALIRALRAERPHLPVVVISGDVPTDWRSAIGATADGPAPLQLVRKPMSMMQLRSALSSVWSACARA